MSIGGAFFGSIGGGFLGSVGGGFTGGLNERMLLNFSVFRNGTNYVYSIPKKEWKSDNSIQTMADIEQFKLPIPYGTGSGTRPASDEIVDPNDPDYRVGVYGQIYGLGGLLYHGIDYVVCHGSDLDNFPERGPLILAYDKNKNLAATCEALPFTRNHDFYANQGYEIDGVWRWVGQSVGRTSNVPSTLSSAYENIIDVTKKAGNGNLAGNRFSLPDYSDTDWPPPGSFGASRGTFQRKTMAIDMHNGDVALVIYGRVDEGPYYKILTNGELNNDNPWTALPNDKTGTRFEDNSTEYYYNYFPALGYRYGSNNFTSFDIRTENISESTYVPKANALVFASGDQIRASLTANKQIVSYSYQDNGDGFFPVTIKVIPPPQGGPHPFETSYVFNDLSANTGYLLLGQTRPQYRDEDGRNAGTVRRAAPFGSIKYMVEEDRLHQVYGYNGLDEQDATYYLHKIQPTTDINDRWDITDSMNLNTLFAGRTYGNTISKIFIREWTKDNEPVVIISSYTDDDHEGDDNDFRLDKSGLDVIVMSSDWTEEKYHVRYEEELGSQITPIAITQLIE